jgi:phospholipase C
VKDLGMTFLPDPPHGWNDTHAAWNGGRHDQWVPNKRVTTMTYHTRKDLPYQYALADAFTICDNYYIGNYGDNSLLYFHQYQFAVPGTPLADRAKTGTNILAHNRQPESLMDIFREDVRHGRLPQVSWIDEDRNAITLDISNRAS